MAEINVNVTANPPTVVQTNVTVQPPTQPVVNVTVPQNSSPVLAVNGYIGYVTLGASDVGLGNVGNYSITGTSGVLQSQINSLTASSGNYATYTQLTGMSGYDATTYATTINLASTGSTLNSRINSLSGTVTANYATITNLATTGSTLASSISSLSGTLTNNYATYAQLTGLSGYDVITYALKSQTGSFVTTAQTGIFATTGQLTSYYPLNNPSGFITGVNLSSYVTTAQTGSFATTGQLASYYPSNNPSGFITGVNTGSFVTTSSASFTVRPTVNGTGVLLSGEASAVVLPSGLVYTTGTQTLGGSYNFTGTLQYNGVAVSTGAADTGRYYPLNNPSGFISGYNQQLNTTNSPSFSGVTVGTLNYTGISGLVKVYQFYNTGTQSLDTVFN